MRRLKFLKFYSLLVLGFLAVFFVLLKPATDPDFGWHLRLGEFMIDQRQIPRQNLFSYTLPDYSWVDSYWLTQILMVFVERMAGLFGLSLVFALIAALAVGISTRFHPFASFLTALLLVPLVGVRPLVLSTLLFSILWFILQKVQKDIRTRWLFCLPLLFLLWANVHADFVLGFLVLGIFLSLEAVRQRKVFVPVLVGLVSVALTLVNPYGPLLWKTLANEAGSVTMLNTIVEWQPTNTHSDFGILLLGFLFLLNLLFFFRKEKPRLSETVLLALFSLLSLFSVYHVRLLAIISGPFLVRGLGKISQRFVTLYAVVCLAVFALVVAPSIQLPEARVEGRALAEAGGYPYEALEFLRSNPQGGNIFNDYAWGGYLIWELPEVKTFIDGRMPAWREGEEYVFEDYITVTCLKPGWEEVLEKYGVSYFLIKNDSALSQALKVHPGWEIIYEDELAVIFGD